MVRFLGELVVACSLRVRKVDADLLADARDELVVERRVDPVLEQTIDALLLVARLQKRGHALFASRIIHHVIEPLNSTTRQHTGSTGTTLTRFCASSLRNLALVMHVPRVSEQQHDLVRLVLLETQRRDVRNEHVCRPAKRRNTLTRYAACGSSYLSVVCSLAQ